MSYSYITQYDSPNFGYPDGTRGQNKPTAIIIHHWGADGYSYQGVINGLCRAGGVSAHYVVEAGKVACIVDESNAAWHAGSKAWNMKSIGIECRPEMSEGDLDTVAELIAGIWKRYGRLPLLGHKDVAATGCPGRYYAKLKELEQRANAKMNGTSYETPSNGSQASSLTIDGLWGMDTTRKAQKSLGTLADGIVSNQYKGSKPYLINCTDDSWEYLDYVSSVGSPFIKKLQTMVGAEADGVAGEETARKLQIFLNSKGANLNTDGILGTESVKAFQKYLNGDLKPKNETPKDTPKQTESSTLYKVQTGAFKDRNNAEKLKKELADKGVNSFITRG